MNFKGQYKKLSIDIGEDKNAYLLDVAMADSVMYRARGLLFHKPLSSEQGLLLSPCNAVHTFFMNYKIDVYFIGDCNKVLKICKSLKPWRQAMCFSARYVLEIKESNERMKNIDIGSKLLWS